MSFGSVMARGRSSNQKASGGAQRGRKQASVPAATTPDAGVPARPDQQPAEVSVICTARNAAATIEHTIESICAQEFQNWEMVIVDDGSTDDTVDIVRKQARVDPRIRLVITGGLGRIRALNRALAEARADLVANIDADDQAHPQLLRCQVQAMQRHPEFAVVAGDWFRIYDAERPNWTRIDKATSFEVNDTTRILAFYNGICHSAVMMRRPVIAGLGGYDEGLACGEDYDLWVRCAGTGLRLGQIALPLVARRIHASQWFEHGPRSRVLSVSLRNQSRAMWVLGMKRYLPLIPIRFLWWMLPLRVRCSVRDLGSAWRLPRRADRGDASS